MEDVNEIITTSLKVPMLYCIQKTYQSSHGQKQSILLYIFSTNQTKDFNSHERLSGKKPTFHYVKVFGSEAFLHNPDILRWKLDKKSETFLLVGYDCNLTNYRLYNPITHRGKVSRNDIFNKERTPIEMKQTVPINVALEANEAIPEEKFPEVEVKETENARELKPGI